MWIRQKKPTARSHSDCPLCRALTATTHKFSPRDNKRCLTLWTLLSATTLMGSYTMWADRNMRQAGERRGGWVMSPAWRLLAPCRTCLGVQVKNNTLLFTHHSLDKQTHTWKLKEPLTSRLLKLPVTALSIIYSLYYYVEKQKGSNDNMIKTLMENIFTDKGSQQFTFITQPRHVNTCSCSHNSLFWW